MPVRLSFRNHQRGSHWTDFRENLCWGLCWNPTKNWALYTKTQVVFHVCSSGMCRTALLCFHGNIVNIYCIFDNTHFYVISTNGMHCCVSMATLSIFTALLTAHICASTVRMERIVAFPWQQWFLVHVMTLLYTFITYLVCYSVLLF